jgi:hypothetical protein
VRAKTHEFQPPGVRLAVDENEIPSRLRTLPTRFDAVHNQGEDFTDRSEDFTDRNAFSFHGISIGYESYPEDFMVPL